MTHYVKVRKIGEKAWFFLGRDLGHQYSLTRKRIHASRFSEPVANTVVVEMTMLNPGYDAKVVPIEKKNPTVRRGERPTPSLIRTEGNST